MASLYCVKHIITGKDILLHIVQAIKVLQLQKVQHVRLSFKQAQAIMKKENPWENHSTSAKMMYLMLSAKAITLLYARLMHHIFYEKELSLCCTFCIRLLLFRTAAGRISLSRQVAVDSFGKYLSNQRQGKVNFRMQSVNQGCLNFTSVPSAEQR